MKKLVAAIASLTITFATQAQSAATPSGENMNWLEILLVLTAIVLLVVIWGLGQVLITIGKQLNEKMKNNSKITLMILFGLFSLQSFAQPSDANATTSNLGGLSQLEFWALTAVIGVEVIVILVLSFMARRMWREYTGEADNALAKAKRANATLRSWWSNLDKNWMTRAVPVEQEADVLLDHDYDGIRELDNALPPWWKYGFYITIVAAFIYIFNFHVFGTGQNPLEEYDAEMKEGKRIEEAYKAKTKNLIDENNITLADASGIAEGGKIFKQTCVACHGQNGEGGIGPNLTDDYWIHGGKMNDLYKTIKLGYPEKGMQSWESTYSPLQMRDLASFVKSLKGTKPANPKAPQGDLFKE
ncbi:MAG: cbb3-type cytochrome c oxidase N-terminal domain-containing protein [Chitinophagaceae bacterium]